MFTTRIDTPPKVLAALHYILDWHTRLPDAVNEKKSYLPKIWAERYIERLFAGKLRAHLDRIPMEEHFNERELMERIKLVFEFLFFNWIEPEEIRKRLSEPPFDKIEDGFALAAPFATEFFMGVMDGSLRPVMEDFLREARQGMSIE